MQIGQVLIKHSNIQAAIYIKYCSSVIKQPSSMTSGSDLENMPGVVYPTQPKILLRYRLPLNNSETKFFLLKISSRTASVRSRTK